MKRALPSDPAYLKAAFKDLGLSEIPGSKHSARVLQLFKLSGHPGIKNDETAWCAAAVGGWLVEGGHKPSGSLMARSYAKYGTACDLKKPVPRGAIMVWPRGAPPSGHVNIALDDDGTYITGIGGNQGNGNGGGVTISRERKSKALAARLPPGMTAAAPKPKPRPVDIEPLPQPDDPGPEPREEAEAPRKKTYITEGGSVFGLTSAVDTLSTGNQVLATVGETKENAVNLGVGDYAAALLSNPRFLISAAFLIAIIGGLIYWQIRKRRT